MVLNKTQRIALKAVYDRDPEAVKRQNGVQSYLEFRRTVRPYLRGGCVIVPWLGMWLGIEIDGYTHS